MHGGFFDSPNLFPHSVTYLRTDSSGFFRNLSSSHIVIFLELKPMNRFILFVLGLVASIFFSWISGSTTPLQAQVSSPAYSFTIVQGVTMPPGTSNYGRDISGYTVYEVFLLTNGTGDVLHRMFSEAGYPMSLSFPGGLYNNIWCQGAVGSGVPSVELVPITELYQQDSYLTVGMSSVSLTNPGTDVIFMPTGHPLSTPFLATTSNVTQPQSVVLDGSVPVQWNLNAAGNPSFKTGGATRRVKVMQFTTSGTGFSGVLNAEVWVGGDSDRSLVVTAAFTGTGFGLAQIHGCTDATACNYEPFANTDDGSCTFPLTVYVDCDGDCLADTDGDGVCDPLEIAGCTTLGSCNYDATATDDDGSCFGAQTWYADADSDGAGDPGDTQVACAAPAGYIAVAGDLCPADGAKQSPGSCGCGSVETDSDSDGVADCVDQCIDATACNFTANPTAACVYAAPLRDCAGDCLADTDGDEVCDAEEVAGCTDSVACNYNASATDDDASCTYPATYYDCAGDCLADADGDGVCDALEVDGCTDASACNFSAGATDDDGSCTYCGCGPLTGLSPASLTVERHAVDGIPGMTTYRLYVNVDDAEDAVTAVYGSSAAEPFVLTSTADPNWYQHPFGADLANTLNPALYSLAPDLAYDSWFTIGAQSNSEVSGFTLALTASAPSNFLTKFNAGQDLNVTDAVGMSYYMTLGCNRAAAPGTAGACDLSLPVFGGVDQRVLIGQITTSGTLSGTLSVFILESGIYTFNQGTRAVFDFDGVGSFSYRGWTGAMASTNHACGCTDAAAINFDPFATLDDGSCTTPVPGCMDGTACNFNGAANVADNAQCTYPTLWYADADGDGAGDPGVTQSACAAPAGYVAVAGDGCPSDVNKTAAGACGCGNADADADADGVADCNDLCLDTTACNFTANPTAACVFALPFRNCAGVCLVDADLDNVCDAQEVPGCTSGAACNFNGAATEDDGSCTFATLWYADADGDGFGDPAVSQSSCTQPVGFVAVAGDGCPSDVNKSVPGPCGCGQVEADGDSDGVVDCLDACTDTSACNYTANPTAACVYAQPLRDCAGNCLVDTDGDGVCNANEVPGCTASTACNYNAAATDDNGTCTFAPTWYADADGDLFGDAADAVTDCVQPAGYVSVSGDGCPNDGSKSAPGVCGCGTPEADADGDAVVDCQDDCTDASACNYLDNPTAACVYPAPLRDCAGDCLADSDSDGVCDAEEVPGCSDPDASNYVAGATDDVPCVYAGCTDAAACNFDCGALVDDGSCTYPAFGRNCAGGCLTDGDGDGVCDVFEVHGCQDAAACNYDGTATDAGYCAYPAAGRNCAGACLADGDGDGVCDGDEVAGCTAHLACNFDPSATEEDGSCTYPSPGYDCAGDCLVDTDGDGTCDALEVLGCTDPTAWNYDGAATEDGGNCLAFDPADSFNSGYNAGFAAGQTAGFASGQTAGYNDGIIDGYLLGYDDGVADGYASGSADGYADGFADGTADGFADGYAAGSAAGSADGYADGFADGTADGYADGYAAGSADGYADGFADGTADGFADGYAAGLAACDGESFCGDGTLWHEDLGVCLAQPGCLGDLDGDAVRGTGDLLLLLSEYGNICEP